MSGGISAKKGFRYQDWCAMYFALDHFKKDNTFEKVTCEQDKLDFEIWNSSTFFGFQAKGNINVTAKDTNDVFIECLNKSVLSGKTNKKVAFVFGQEPKKSLAHLFSYVRGDGRGVIYPSHVKKFIDTALINVPFSTMDVSYYYFTHEQIEYLVFSLSTEILKQRFGNGLKTRVVQNFISALRNEIDKVSIKPNSTDRFFTTVQISSSIDEFLSDVKVDYYEYENNIPKKVEICPVESIREKTKEEIVPQKPISIKDSNSKDGKPIKNI